MESKLPTVLIDLTYQFLKTDDLLEASRKGQDIPISVFIKRFNEEINLEYLLSLKKIGALPRNFRKQILTQEIFDRDFKRRNLERLSPEDFFVKLYTDAGGILKDSVPYLFSASNNFEDKVGKALIRATVKNDLNLIQFYLQKYEPKRKVVIPALELAAKFDDVETVALLEQIPGEEDIKNKIPHSQAFENAAGSGSNKVIDYYIQNFPYDQWSRYDENSFEAIENSVTIEDVKTTKKIIDYISGINPVIKEKKYKTVNLENTLEWALIQSVINNSVDVMKMLLQNYDINREIVEEVMFGGNMIVIEESGVLQGQNDDSYRLLLDHLNQL